MEGALAAFRCVFMAYKRASNTKISTNESKVSIIFNQWEWSVDQTVEISVCKTVRLSHYHIEISGTACVQIVLNQAKVKLQ